LQPATRRVVVVNGASVVDHVWLTAARSQLDVERYRARVAIEYVTGLPLDDLLRQVAALAPGTIVMFGAYTRDGAGQDLITAQVAGMVADRSSVPVYGPNENFIGEGVVGGRVVSFSRQGARAAELAASLLGGQRPRPLDRGANAYVFDWRQLNRWGLDETRLP